MSGADLFVHSFDATMTPCLPALVIIPSEVDDLAWVCEKLWSAGVAVTPRGAGTGFSGGAVPVAGGAVVVCDRLKTIRMTAADEVTVGPGVVGDDLNRFLSAYGLFYPVDPASAESSTVGGHVAENAGGPRAFKYGVTGDYVRALEILSPARGREVVVARRGAPDVLGALVGSEGTLTVFLEIKLRVIPKPASAATVVASFAGTTAAGYAVAEILNSGLKPSRLEFLDGRCIRAVDAVRRGVFNPDAEAALMVEFDGFPEEVEGGLRLATEILRKAGASTVGGRRGKEADYFWETRRGISPALARIAPHKINEDVCVPRSRLPSFLDFIKRLEARYGIPIPTFGHIGDGNLHVNFMFDRNEDGAPVRAAAAVSALMEEVVAAGGTVTGEHGIGIAKISFLNLEWHAGAFRLARRLKEFFDPQYLLNPGKVFPKAETSA